jgi:hypothetical protein
MLVYKSLFTISVPNTRSFQYQWFSLWCSTWSSMCNCEDILLDNGLINGDTSITCFVSTDGNDCSVVTTWPSDKEWYSYKWTALRSSLKWASASLERLYGLKLLPCNGEWCNYIQSGCDTLDIINRYRLPVLCCGCMMIQQFLYCRYYSRPEVLYMIHAGVGIHSIHLATKTSGNLFHDQSCCWNRFNS